MTDKDLHILVVDDVPSARKAIVAVLHRMGYKNIRECGNGEEAVRALGLEQFGLIISDWDMPGINGLDLLTLVKKSASLSSTPFVMITSASSRDEVLKAGESGVNHYIIKPFSASTFERTIEKALGEAEGV